MGFGAFGKEMRLKGGGFDFSKIPALTRMQQSLGAFGKDAKLKG
jgi:hypothetical protein